MSNNAPEPTPAHRRGSSPVGGPAPRRTRGKLIGLIVAAAVVLAVLVLLLSRCSGDDGSDSASASATAASSSSSSQNVGSSGSSSSSTAGGTSSPANPTSAGPAAGTPGTVTVGAQSLLDAAASTDPASALAVLTGQPVTGTAVQVLSVPADKGFWVGTSDAARVWVQLTGGGESTYQVTAGDTVDFTGTLVAHDATFATTVGVDDTEGAAQLTTQAQHVEVAKNAVALSA